MTRHTIRIESEELDDLLEDAENKSEMVRDGLRLWQRENADGEYPDLDGDQALCYECLLEMVGPGGHLTMEAAKNELAQEISKNMRFVKERIIKPLHREGFIDVQQRISRVDVEVRAPEREIEQ